MKKKEKAENVHFIAIKNSILVLSEVPYLLNYRCCQSVKSPCILYLLVSLIKLERVPLYCLFTLSLSIKNSCSSQWYPDLFTWGPPLPTSPHLSQIYLWLCWDPTITTLPTTTPPPPSSHLHHPNVKKMRSGLESSHCELPDSRLLVSVIAWAFKAFWIRHFGLAEAWLWRHSPPSSRVIRMQENKLRSDLGPPHYWLSNAPSRIFSFAKKNFITLWTT